MLTLDYITKTWERARMKNSLYLLASLLLLTIACADGDNTTDKPEVLFVQYAAGGSISDDGLTLTGVGSGTAWFTDRPFRLSGRSATEEFVSRWNDGRLNSFEDDPPNAAFSCTVDGQQVSYAVELSSPRFEGDDLTYSVRSISDSGNISEASCDSDSQLFLDAGGWMAYCEKDSDCDSGCCPLPNDGQGLCAWCFGCQDDELIGPNCTQDSDCDSFTEGLTSDGIIGKDGAPAACFPASAFCDSIWECSCDLFPGPCG